MSLRSKGKVNVAAIAEGLGGGGHENAPGCTRRRAASPRAGRDTDDLLPILLRAASRFDRVLNEA